MKIAVAVTLSLAVLAGCPGASRSGSPPTRCTRLEERCSLGNGVLGVCSESRCAPGEAPPCIKCTSQH